MFFQKFKNVPITTVVSNEVLSLPHVFYCERFISPLVKICEEFATEVFPEHNLVSVNDLKLQIEPTQIVSVVKPVTALKALDPVNIVEVSDKPRVNARRYWLFHLPTLSGMENLYVRHGIGALRIIDESIMWVDTFPIKADEDTIITLAKRID